MNEDSYLTFWEAVLLIAPEDKEFLKPQYLGNDKEPNTFYKLDKSVEIASELHHGKIYLAEAMLVRAMWRGLLRAYGITKTATDSLYREISPSFFINADRETEDDGGEAFYDGDTEYQDVHVNAEDLDKLFGWWINDDDEKPDNSNKARENVLSSNKSENDCKKWAINLIKTSPILTKRSLWSKAQEKFGPSLSYRGFCRVWDTTAPTEWKAAGRRKNHDGISVRN